jgi:hypothetical protein
VVYNLARVVSSQPVFTSESLRPDGIRWTKVRSGTQQKIFEVLITFRWPNTVGQIIE